METVRVTVPLPPGTSATFDVLREVVGSDGESDPVRLVAVTLAVRSMPPEKPLILVSMIVDWPELAIGIASDCGLAVRPKSSMFTPSIIEWVRLPPAPVIITR